MQGVGWGCSAGFSPSTPGEPPMVTLDTTDIADRARALVGRPVTVYTRDQEWGTVVDHGLLGHVHQGVYLTMARDRTDRGLPPELVRVRLSTVEDVHPEAEGARSEEHTSELQSRGQLVGRQLLGKKNEDNRS